MRGALAGDVVVGYLPAHRRVQHALRGVSVRACTWRHLHLLILQRKGKLRD